MFEEILAQYPALAEYVRHMPEALRGRYTLKTFPAHTVVHQKDSTLQNFGIVYSGEHRVINEFENGNIFMIEKNEAVSFLGEVTLLAEMETTSVTIETLTEIKVMFFSIEDFRLWISQDIHFLRLLSRGVARKLYHTSYNRGERHFYSSRYLLLKYIIEYAQREGLRDGAVVIRRTRQQLYEELGMTVKTLGRTIERLREDGIVSLVKGKMCMTAEQYAQARRLSGIYVQENRKGLL